MSDTRGSNHWSWTSDNPGFSSQKTQREGDPNGESPLG